ncbi:TAF5 [Lepeophtheirus salmonis]|uniref:TAF5 n=1 Tax=Lepeophtheirus salmonis TaxID=72036 RepID=A0A7R8D042_LEPSM|nr:TAF5 [Lepeophtheirus salmonis]CAF2980136.1 TAF5 [Lepeophtheirus salmonis]
MKGVMSLKSRSGVLSSSTPTPEVVESAILRYQAKRRLSPASPVVWKQSLDELALSEMLLGEASDNEAPLFSPFPAQPDPVTSETQYGKFKAWISESPEALKPELAQLLYPMFTHLYLDLISSGQHPSSSKFLRRHQSTFLGNAEFNAFIRLLSSINSPRDLSLNDHVNAFRSSKYTVTLSTQTYNYLIKYVHQGKSSLLLRLLQSKIDLKLADPLAACSRPEALQRIRSEMNRDLLQQSINDKNTTNNDIQRLKEIIQSVRSGPSPLPSTCLYRINNVPSPLASAELSYDSSLMALGSENSSIYLYNLLPSTTRVKREDNHARIKLSCDFFGDNEDDVRSGGESKERTVPELLLGHSEDTSMRLWETSTGANKVVYSGHSYPVWCVDVDRLGYNIVTGSMDRTAKLWNTEYTFPIRIYAGHEKDVDCIAFHPNCNYFATGSVDKSIRLWSHADAKMVRVLTGHKSGVYSLAFSPDGKYLASGGEDRRIRIWDLASSRQLKELKGHTDTVYSLVWSTNSSHLSSGGLDGVLRIWDMNNPSPQNSSTSSSSSEESGTPTTSSSSKNISCSPVPELIGTYKTNCSNILDLRYSHHNTLLVTAIMEEPKT